MDEDKRGKIVFWSYLLVTIVVLSLTIFLLIIFSGYFLPIIPDSGWNPVFPLIIITILLSLGCIGIKLEKKSLIYTGFVGAILLILCALYLWWELSESIGFDYIDEIFLILGFLLVYLTYSYIKLPKLLMIILNIILGILLAKSSLVIWENITSYIFPALGPPQDMYCASIIGNIYTVADLLSIILVSLVMIIIFRNKIKINLYTKIAFFVTLLIILIYDIFVFINVIPETLYKEFPCSIWDVLKTAHY